jgi:hypothetical protein
LIEAPGTKSAKMIERMIRGFKNDFIWIRFLMIVDREFQKQSGLSISKRNRICEVLQPFT